MAALAGQHCYLHNRLALACASALARVSDNLAAQALALAPELQVVAVLAFALGYRPAFAAHWQRFQ